MQRGTFSSDQEPPAALFRRPAKQSSLRYEHVTYDLESEARINPEMPLYTRERLSLRQTRRMIQALGLQTKKHLAN